MSTGKAVALLLVFGAIAAVAWQVGRVTERKALRDGAAASPTAVSPAFPLDVPTAVPGPAELPPEAEEAEATYELPARDANGRPINSVDPPATAVWVPPESRPADTAARCLMLQAYPSNVSAYGSFGEVVQLVVRAQNGCSTNFGYASFRAIAIGPDGREVASAVGSFSGGIHAGGSAETLIAVRAKPGTSMTYRAEVQ
ncbi:MAG: hypothetical protein ABI610_12120 [Acidobacteriota bacterium]